MVKYGSISAWINVDGAPLPEYGEDVIAAEDKVVCWVPSEAGKEFTVNIRHERCSLDVASYVYVDGKYINGGFITPFNATGKDSVCVSALATSAITERTLMFAGLDLTDDDGLLGSDVSPELGEIKVEHWHVMKGQKVPFQPHRYEETGPVHERSKKAISHRTQLGASSSTQPRHTRRAAVKVTRLLTVVFRYRPIGEYHSQGMLQANGLAPPPAPVPSTSSLGSRKRSLTPDDDVINISDEDSDEDAARIAKLEAELKRLQNRNRRPNKKAKREPSVKQEKRQKAVFDPNDVLDLT
ncbi:hypothetical protein BDZ89DRAFT_1111367 [Hymenopellis radicata]|nr:hypothetical protein BDZ89DRAFT_1111367 [Hymenopellis radicata]